MPRLQAIGENIWIADGPVVDFYSFPYSTRMVVVRLPEQRLWVWSPIELDTALKEEIAALGIPAFLVSPNKIHHLYLAQWANIWPEAEIWALDALRQKRPDLAISHILTDTAPTPWADDIDQVIFAGSPFMTEAVFFHHPSKTAIFADLTENFSQDFLNNQPGWTWWKRAIARLWRITEPYGRAPLEWRLSFFGHKKRASKALQKVLSWNPDQVVMAHGTWINTNGRDFIEKSFAWLK